jgi:hypothetical protein
MFKPYRNMTQILNHKKIFAICKGEKIKKRCTSKVGVLINPWEDGQRTKINVELTDLIDLADFGD